MACPTCFGLMFIGAKHCSHCGAKTVRPEIPEEKTSGTCPRCRTKLNLLQIDQITIRECQNCSGLWAAAETFEQICAERESQAAVLGFISQKPQPAKNIPVRYVPCPDCRQLMNRHNFARSSAVIVDICKQHGVWFDAEELPRIIEFIHRGGLDRARQKEKLQIEEQRKNLREEERKLAVESSKFNLSVSPWESSSTGLAVREFVRFLFD